VITPAVAWDRVLAQVDPISLLPALARTGWSIAARPERMIPTLATGLIESWSASTAAVVRALGGESDTGPERTRDRRFADPAWEQNAAYWLTRQLYRTWGETLLALVRNADTAPATKQKAEFAVQLLIDAAAPTNTVPGNPAVLKKALETGGLSLARGARNFARDLLDNDGSPRQVATGTHIVGQNMAVTPGKVIFRNDLMELIQYAPSTPETYAIPLLCSPPWINKYYIMDLAPGRSLVQWAVDHGHTVFMISYRNPDASLGDVALDDYLLSGPITALEVITEITGSDKVNLLGLCLGGTLTMASLAYLDATGQDVINSATFLNTLIDFREPGLLGVFTDEATIGRLERIMKRTGFLPARDMQRTFNLLRTNDLIWNYVVSSWLMGEEPPVFDLLSWNNDSTRMPAEMHAFYLRSCYLENQLARGVMELGGQRLDVAAVDQDLYLVAAEQDHIAPWRSAYAGARIPAGQVRFVLSNSGHIAGIVNPPGPKSLYRVVESGELPEDPEDWLTAAATRRATWWEDWARWMSTRSGELGKPPRMGSRRHQSISDAPGAYVREA
jgi:polyhydroxyalkanoate synthase